MSSRKQRNRRKGAGALSQRIINAFSAVASRYRSQRFTPVALESLSIKEITSELSRARSIFRKRVERGINANIFTRDQISYFQSLLTPVKDILSEYRAERLSELARLLSRPDLTTITGARTRIEKIISNFNNSGFDYINTGNIQEFLDFISEFSAAERDKSYGSGILYQYYEQQKERQRAGDRVKISKRSFEIWLRKQEGEL